MTETTYDSQLMMAIIAASAALLGLTGVIMGQIMQSSLNVRRKKVFATGFLLVLGFSSLAIVISIFWFYSPEGWEKTFAVSIFGGLIIGFLFLVSAYWQREIVEEQQADKRQYVWEDTTMKLKQFVFRFLSWLVIFIFAGSLVCFIPGVRSKIFLLHKKNQLMNSVWRNLDKVLMLSYLWLLFLPLFITWQVIGSGLPRLEALVAGLVLVVFVAFQLPRLIKPYVVVLMLETTSQGYKDNGSTTVQVKKGKPNLIFFRLTNTGTSFYKDLQCWVILYEGFMPLDDNTLYNDIDFRKDFEIQRQNRTAKFAAQNVAPTNHLVFPLWFDTPKKIGKYIVDICVASESTWGEFSQRLQVEVM